MNKVVFLFPGVGSQYVGMGKSLYENFPIFREAVEEVGDILKLDFNQLFFSPKKKEELNKLENAQSALLTASIATYRIFMQEIGIQPHYCMGHSLGEYSALCAAGVIRFRDALKLVRDRALVVNAAAEGVNGTMMWVVNLDVEILENVCRDAAEQEQEVYISAYDSPTQASISGHTDTLMKVAKGLEKKGAIVYPLKFNGPFHCPLMKEAAEKMKPILQQYHYEKPRYTVIANRDALPYNDAESVVDNLSLQLISPIHWKASVEYLVEQKVDIAIEMGPKNVLKFLMQKNPGSLQTYTMDNTKDLELIVNHLTFQQEEYVPLIGRCLGAAVGTKNRNPDAWEYEEYVVKPYRKIEAMYRELQSNGMKVGKDEVKDAVEMLHAVMAAKKVPEQEQKYWFDRIFGNKTVSF